VIDKVTSWQPRIRRSRCNRRSWQWERFRG